LTAIASNSFTVHGNMQSPGSETPSAATRNSEKRTRPAATRKAPSAATRNPRKDPLKNQNVANAGDALS
jgi:hypothetical protein